MATQAKVTFTALNGDADLIERTLTLHPNLRTIQIGRASKTASKGLQAAVDNAWFDSPVMSRNHAEISLSVENKVYIQDIGSMHGTFVNDSQLGQHEPQELSNGDKVVFGVEVKRNLDTFPACVFQINYELLPIKANVSYAFPDSDEEDYEISNDEEIELPSSEDGVSIESPPRKDTQATDAIDFTKDESEANSDIECTSETRVEKDIMGTMAGRPADIDQNADQVSVALSTGNSPLLVDTDDEDGQFSSDSDDESEVEYGGDASSRGNSMDEQVSEASDSDGNGNELKEEDSESRDSPDKESERASGLPNVGLYTLMNQLIPESNVRTIIEVSDNNVEEDDQDDDSEFGLSAAGDEGIRALFDDGLIDNDGHAYFKDDEERGSASVIGHEALVEAPVETSMANNKFGSPKSSTFADPASEQPPEITSNFPHFNAFVQTNNEDSLRQTNMKIRQPSPSDAAMVKTANPSATLINDSANAMKVHHNAMGVHHNAMEVHHMPIQEFQKLSSRYLGDKTGKHAFFAAREDNRAKIYGGQNDHSGQTAKTGPSSTAEEQRERSRMAMAKFRERKRKMAEEAKSKLSEFSNTIPIKFPTTEAVNSTIRSFAGPSYLNDHSQALKTMHPLSPEPDMTSAVAYNQSKASMASANELPSNPSGRSGLSINDIIEGAGDHTFKPQKRKAGDISEAIEKEIRVWASSSPAPNCFEGSTAMSASTSQAPIREEQSETISAASNQNEQRPAKRLRRIVESVGYVALGGATLFGALVLSAPDFL